MLTIQLTGFDKAKAQLGALGKQLPFATSQALNEVGRKVIATETAVMKSVFDRPAPFTVNALRLEPATKSRLTVTVLTKDGNGADRSASRWLTPEAFGGARREKGFERSLRAAGILPGGMFVVPAEGARRDGFGNWSRAHMNQVLVAMRQAGTAVAARRIAKLQAKDAARKRALPQRFFLVQQTGGELEPGIWERKGTRWGTGVRPVALFVRSLPIYRRRFPFAEVAERVARKEFAPCLDRAVAAAIATAR